MPTAERHEKGANRRSLVWLLVLLATAAMLSVMAVRNVLTFLVTPATAEAALGVALNDGIARQQAARARFAADMGGDRSVALPQSVPDAAVRLAREAYRQEPLATTAIAIMGIDIANRGRAGVGRTVVDAAAAMSKRDALAGIWLVGDYARTADVALIVDRYDIILRTNMAARPVLLAQLAQALQNSALIAPLADKLAERPNWSADFWISVSDTSPALRNAALLRESLAARGGYRFDSDRDSRLIAKLADNGDFGEAIRLFDAIAGSARRQGSEQIRNPDFSTGSLAGPVDWQLVSTGDFGAMIDPRAGILSVSSISQSPAVVARQLLDLRPGRYRLEVEMQQAVDGQPLSIAMACQQPDVAVANFQQPVSTGRMTRDFIIATGSCRYYFLDVVSAASSVSQGIDLGIDRVSVRRID
jgi:hypothetical protein